MESVGLATAAVGLCAGAIAFSLKSARSADGLTILSAPTSSDLDIVFVHNIDSERQDGTPTTGPSDIGWTTDALRDRLQNRARILKYKYSLNSSSGRRVSNWRIEAKDRHSDENLLRFLPQAVRIHSNHLLADLIRLRGENAQDRPIIWIGHALGGLVVKHTLIQASAAVGEGSKQKAIHLATCGALYFETPMRETPQRSWLEILASMMSVDLRKSLSTDAERFNLTFDEFDLQSQRYKSIEQDFDNFSFSKQTRNGKRNDPQIPRDVPQEALVLGNRFHQWTSIKLHTSDIRMLQLQKEDRERVIESIQKCFKNIERTRQRSCFYHEQLEDCQLQHRVSHSHQKDIADPRLDDKVQPNTTELKLPRLDTTCSLQNAKNLLRKSESQYGYVHKQTILSVIILAQKYESESSFLKAELLYKRALVATFTPKTYLSMHMYVAELWQRLSEVEVEQGKFTEAIGHLLQLHSFQEKKYGKTDLVTTRTMARIAVLYDKVHRWHEAEKAYLFVIKTRREQGKDETGETLTVRENLALSYRLRGKSMLESSKTEYLAVYKIRKTQFENFKWNLGLQTKNERTMEALKESSEYKSLEDVTFRLAEVYESLNESRPRQELLDEWALSLRSQKKATTQARSA